MSRRFREAFLPRPAGLAMAWLLLLAIIALLPHFVTRTMAEPFMLGKQSVLEAGLALVLALSLGAACTGRRLRVLLTPTNGFLFLLVLWGTLSMLWSEAPRLAIEESARWWWLLAALVLFQNITNRRRAAVIWAGYALAASSSAVALLVLIKDFRAAFDPGSVLVANILGDWRDAVSSVALGNSGHVADFLALGFILTLAHLAAARGRARVGLCLAVLWLHAAGLIVAWSVHSNLSVIVGTVVFGALIWRRLPAPRKARMAKPLVVLAAGWVLIVGFYVVDHPLNPHGSRVWAPAAEAEFQQSGREYTPDMLRGGIFAQAFSSARWQIGLESREAIWLTTLEAIRERPWLGWGGGTFSYAYAGTISPIVRDNPRYAGYSGRWTNDAHNDLLHAWLESGIVGVFLLVVVIATAFKGGWDRLKVTSFGNAVIIAGVLGALSAQLVQMQMSFPLQLPVSSLLFVLLLGVPPVLPRKTVEEEALLMPVQRSYGPIDLEVMMKNMARPSELAVGISAGRAGGAVLAVLLLLAGGALAWFETRPIRADIGYAPVRATKLVAERTGTLSPSVAASLLDRCAAALDQWPHHVDCRSAYQDLLLRAGHFEGVVEQTPLVLEKLNATEVYMRRAIALEALGRGEGATPDWDVVFTRVPEHGRSFPHQFNAFVDRLEAAGK